MDYKALEKQVNKELATKRKALKAAEKRLAKAQKDVQGLGEDISRLDMLEKSLKAVNNKTEPPKEVVYVPTIIYTQPPLIWPPAPCPSYPWTAPYVGDLPYLIGDPMPSPLMPSITTCTNENLPAQELTTTADPNTYSVYVPDGNDQFSYTWLADNNSRWS